MANPCEVYNEWFDEESENVIQELGELINQALEQWGFDPIEVVEGDLSDRETGGLYEDGVITLDQSHEIFDNPYTAIYTAYHEAMHAAFDQAGYEFEHGLFGGEEEAYGVSLGMTAANQALEGCKSLDPASDSSYDDKYAPPYPFISPA